jgi:uncharacterized protein YprB with RNaseH-like and TPR domain
MYPPYAKEVRAFVKMKIEQTSNNAEIARQVKKIFDIEQPQESVRVWISGERRRTTTKAKQSPLKRLFFDIETSYFTVRSWSIGKARWIDPAMMITQKQIICISYKWQYEDVVHTLDWSKGEETMIRKFIKILNTADEIIGHNGDRFDIRELRTRCIAYGIKMFPNYRTLDTLKKARQYFKFPSNKLDYLGEYLQVGRKLDHEGIKLWIDVVENKSKKALDKMIAYCEQDVISCYKVFKKLTSLLDIK